MVNFSDIQDRFVGNWAGENLLRLSWITPPDYFSPTTMSVARVAKGKFLTFTYTWSHENIAQEGQLVLGYDIKQSVATAAWIDSWHQSSKILSCTGRIDEHGVVDLLGAYEAPPGPDWGWRIVLTPSDGGLQRVMYNITPEGEEDLAVRAVYERVEE